MYSDKICQEEALATESTSSQLNGLLELNVQKSLILLVENNSCDQLLIKRAITLSRLAIRVEWVTNGQEAIKYLEGNGDYANRERYPLPALIVTDIEMPILSGLELLTWIKGQIELTDIPVVVMSTSGDREQAIRRGACEYLEKTHDFKSLINTLEALCSRAVQDFPLEGEV